MKLEELKQKSDASIFSMWNSKKEGQELPFLMFRAFQDEPHIRHGFTTRRGGVSTGIFESLNLSFTRGDDPAAVMENYRRVADAFQVSLDRIVTSDQTHTTNVRVVSGKDGGSGVLRQRDYQDVDGMITQEKGLLLATFYADCVPLYFYDPVQEAIGLSHSGWRGTVGRMGAHTLEMMTKEFGTNPKDVLSAVGPSICQDCYEVSEDVATAFQKEFGDAKVLKPGNAPGKFQLDLWKANETVLLEAGILPEHLSVTNICTACNPSVLFSHRASHGKRGNLGAFLMLVP